mmetsp:Transcript_15482/g.24287  ORF Transcript_15482/g.24287 Transcript_15482/m.24287 type:complete len:104 (-) Transcript_15482:297-608(-)
MSHIHAKIARLNTDIMISRSGYTGEDGYELSVLNQKAIDLSDVLLECGNIKPCGLGSRDSLRLEAGLCLHGNDMNDKRTPAEATLMWTVRKNPDTKFIGYDKL